MTDPENRRELGRPEENYYIIYLQELAPSRNQGPNQIRKNFANPNSQTTVEKEKERKVDTEKSASP
jgi:hypothetical protein